MITPRDRRMFARANQKAAKSLEQRMRLGFGDGTTLFVTGRDGFVYARPHTPSSATAAQVRCERITPAYGLWVIVRPGDDGILEVDRTDPRGKDFAGSTGMNFDIARHGTNHGAYGADPVYIEGQQYRPLAVTPTTPASTSVHVYKGWYLDDDGIPQWWAGGSIDLAAEIAALTTDQQQLVIIALDIATGALTKTTGVAIVAATTPGYDMPFETGNVQDIVTDATEQRLQAVRIYAGQTTLQAYDTIADFDLRNWFGVANSTLGNTNEIVVKDVNLTIQDDADTTKQFKFQASGISAATTRTYTMPNRDTGFVILTPGASTDNVIQPSGDFKPLVIKGNASQTANLLELQNSSGAVQISTDVGGGAVFNEQGNSAGDVRIEGDTNQHLLFTDASADVVGIGTDTPISKLHVLVSDGATTSASEIFYLEHHSSGTPAAGFGTIWRFRGHSSTNTVRNMGDILVIWSTATDASRSAAMHLRAHDSVGARTGIIITATGTEALVDLARTRITQATVGNEVVRIQSTATNDDPTEIVYQNRAATTDATVTTLHTFTVPASTTYMIEARVTARRTGGTGGTAEDGAGYVIRGTYKNVAGTATLIGAVNADYTAEDQAAWDATFTVSGATVLVRVTGAANNNISWHMTARVYQVSS